MRKFLSIVIIVLLAASCNKSSIEGKTSHPGITGKWRYVQNFYSPGDRIIYNSTENLKQWIDFEPDGSFASNMPLFEKVTQYEALDSLKYKFITPPPMASSHLYFVYHDSIKNSLTISSAEYICIEGCGDVFKR